MWAWLWVCALVFRCRAGVLEWWASRCLEYDCGGRNNLHLGCLLINFIKRKKKNKVFCTLSRLYIELTPSEQRKKPLEKAPLRAAVRLNCEQVCSSQGPGFDSQQSSCVTPGSRRIQHRLTFTDFQVCVVCLRTRELKNSCFFFFKVCSSNFILREVITSCSPTDRIN